MSPSQPRFARLVSRIALPPLVIAASLAPLPIAHAQSAPRHRITWDTHSLILDGRRLMLYSGEFHYWRLPSRQGWLDRLEKMKAAGLNAVSIYFDWQYHSNAPGQYDFSGVRDVDYLLRLTERVGLYVIARVGPYMNAEVDAGGLPGWLLGKQLYPRAQSWDGTTAHPQYSALYSQYSREWYDHLLPILADHQVTSGGSVILMSIENEYSQDTGSAQYMQDLYNYARADGIDVPIFHNDYYFKGAWSKLVDLYAYDSYPYGFSCCHQWWDEHFHGMDTWETTLRSQLNVTTPMFVSELQGGSFDPWGGKGYKAIAGTLGSDWLSAIDESALAQGTTIVNTYMFVGGTSWGYMTEPGVYTSYDYGAPISESGDLRPAYYAAHRLGAFLQTYGASLAGASAATTASATNQAVVVHSRINPDNGQFFAFLRHGDAGAAVQTKLQLALSNQQLVVPQKPGSFITLPGHGSALLTGNVDVGPLHLNYSTSQVMMDAATDSGQYLVLYGPEGSSGETDFALPAGSVSVDHNAGVQVTRLNNQLRLNYVHTNEPRSISIQTPAGTLHVVATTTYAASRYWFDQGMVIGGPDLVVDEGGSLRLYNRSRREVRVYGSPEGGSLRVDGRMSAEPDAFMSRTLLGKLSGPSAVQLPVLHSWKFSPASPETDPSFDDQSWAQANHSSTANPNVPASTTTLADDYGFHYGFVWYRGHFTASGDETGIELQARQSYSVYLNGSYLGSADTSLADPPHPYASWVSFPFPAGALRPGQDNVIAVLTESLGHDEGWIAGPVAQSPQGLLRAQFDGAATPISWRLQGAQGAEQPADQMRGLLNASGLFGERQGWYQPGFDDGAWATINTPDSWQRRGVHAAIGWYRTHFELNLRSQDSTPIGLRIPRVSDKAVIWVNGWLIGRYWQQRGPQHEFYLPEGILNRNGDNVVAIAVWNRGHLGGLVAQPSLFTYPSLTQHDLSVGAAAPSGTADYWHTSGNRIVDSQGRPVRIAAINWSGMQGTTFVPSGLDRQPLDAIVRRVRDLGFNTIRLPFSNQLVEQNPTITAGVDANTDLKGLHALDVMDRIVAAAANYGLRVILDNHRSNVGADPQENGLWYTTQYPETSWIHDWTTLSERYKGNATVVGVDLRDEPHTAPPGPWSVKTYLNQGATWGPYHGIESEARDWRLGAQRGGNAVLAVNPHLLIFVEGLQQYPDPSQPGGLDSYWWGGVFQPAARYPLALAVPHQLVYSPHEYGPVKYPMPFFGPGMSYRTMAAVWDKHWGFLESAQYSQQAPIFIGEFGTCGQSARCVVDSAPGSQGLWFQLFMRYLKEHPQIGWAFWALNGTNVRGDPQPNYVLRTDWKTTRLRPLVDTFRDVETAPPPAA